MEILADMQRMMIEEQFKNSSDLNGEKTHFG